MARKKKRRARSKKSNPTKKRSHKRKKHRRSVANPPRRKRRSHKRRSNPGRRMKRRSHARRRHNPSHFRRKHRRHTRRRNPGGPYGQAAIAVAAGAAAFVGVNALTYYATGDMAANGERNRKIIAAVATAAGLYLAVAKQKVALGIAIAAGGLLGGFGNFLILKLMQHLPAKPPAPKQSAVFTDNMQGYEQLGAVAYDNMQGYEQLGAVAYDNMQGMGEPVPAAPWDSPNPF